MIPLSEFKQKLRSTAQGMSDQEIEQLREAEYQLADIIFDRWLKTINNNPNKKFVANDKLCYNKNEANK